MTLIRPLLRVQGWRGRGFDLLLGALAVLGHAPFHFWPITLLCFAMLMARLDAARDIRSSGFRTAFSFAFGYFLAGTFWIGSAFIVRGPEFIPAMPPMILGLAALLAVFWGIVGRLYVRWAGEGGSRWIALVTLLWIAEFTRGHILGGFPWNLPGYVFEAGKGVSQIASYVGIYGLSFLVLGLACNIARYVFTGFDRLLGSLAILFIPLFMLLDAGHVGKVNLPYHGDINIRVVQVPFSQKDKFDRETSIAIVNDFIRTSLEPGIEDVTHLVWPEGAIIGLALENEPLITAMGSVLSEGDDTPPYWIINSLREETHPAVPGRPAKAHYYNTSAIIGFNSDGVPRLAGFNDKAKLVPFGEFIPGGEVIENLGGTILSTSLGSITPAREKQVADFPGLPTVSPQICYEIIFPGMTPNADGNNGAQWILNQSNDAWFGQTVGPAQHANIAAYRAIEEGIPVVRSASNGVSGLIDPYGRYVQKLGPQSRGVIDIRLPQPREGTIYAKWMDWVLLLINLLLLAITLVLSRRNNTTA